MKMPLTFRHFASQCWRKIIIANSLIQIENQLMKRENVPKRLGLVIAINNTTYLSVAIFWIPTKVLVAVHPSPVSYSHIFYGIQMHRRQAQTNALRTPSHSLTKTKQKLINWIELHELHLRCGSASVIAGLPNDILRTFLSISFFLFLFLSSYRMTFVELTRSFNIHIMHSNWN